MQSIHIVDQTLPAAWERAVLACWDQGADQATEYDKPNDPQSRDVVALIHVTHPMAEPRIHRAMPAGLADLEKYRDEVVLGVHDHWVHPEEGKWQYTYHGRLFGYEVPGMGTLDQIERVIEKLSRTGHTRRAQAVTWKAWEDMEVDDPACLQRLWFRVESGRLNLNVHMRSNDAYKAAFMNMFAFTDLQQAVADRLGVAIGEYIHIADSFHIYGSYFPEFDGFRQSVAARAPQDRYFTTAFALPMFVDGVNELLAEPDMPDDKHAALRDRLAALSALQAHT